MADVCADCCFDPSTTDNTMPHPLESLRAGNRMAQIVQPPREQPFSASSQSLRAAEIVQPHRATASMAEQAVPVSPQLQRIRDVKAQLKKYLNDVTDSPSQPASLAPTATDEARVLTAGTNPRLSSRGGAHRCATGHKSVGVVGREVSPRQCVAGDFGVYVGVTPTARSSSSTALPHWTALAPCSLCSGGWRGGTGKRRNCFVQRASSSGPQRTPKPSGSTTTSPPSWCHPPRPGARFPVRRSSNPSWLPGRYD